MKKLQTKKAPHALKGEVTIPGDKSISHRAIMLSAIAEGETRIHGLLEGEDVMATIAAFQAMGVIIEKHGDIWHVRGVGLKGLKKPEQALDMGNSGTSARLIMGILAGQDFETTITGDESLCKRPMKRVTEPLTGMGANFEFLENDGCLPLKVKGNTNLNHLPRYIMPVASAQVKSAILLATLYTQNKTTIIEQELTRNHTETMMQQFGIELKQENTLITLQGGQDLESPENINIPADPSSAAFFIAAALLVPNSEITLKNISINSTRIGFFETVQEMGAEILMSNEFIGKGEFTADLTVFHSKMSHKFVYESRVASMIDEYPILSILAVKIDGGIEMDGIGELRFKESDRIAAMEEGLRNCGFHVELRKNQNLMYVVFDNRKELSGGVHVKTYMDHRIAMSFIILGLIAENPIVLDDVSPIMTSFPTFFTELKKLGVDFDL